MSTVLTIAGKDLNQLVRDRAGLFWVIAFPLIASILFGAVFAGEDAGSTRPVDIAVVDDDGSAAAQRMAARLAASPSLKVEPLALSAAQEEVRKGKVVAYIRFLPGYGSAEEETLPGDANRIEIGMDPSKRATTAVLMGLLMQAIFAEMHEVLTDRDALRAAVRVLATRFGDDNGPQSAAIRTLLDGFVAGADLDQLAEQLQLPTPAIVDVEESRSGAPSSSYDITFPQSLGWALIAIISFFATVIARERETGTLLRLRMAPIGLAHILAGKGLAALVAGIMIVLFVLSVGVLGFGLNLVHYGQLAMAVVCGSFAAAGLMLLFSTLGKTAQAVEAATWTIMIPLLMAGGGMLPLVFMPEWLRTISNFSPIKWHIYAFEGATWRGFSFSEMLLPCAILIAIGVAGFAVGCLMLARSER